MRLHISGRARVAALAIAGAVAIVTTAGRPRDVAPARAVESPVPAIVFVSRNPVAGDRGIIPGLGPTGRTVITGGRLLVRESDGRIRELLPRAAMYDVSDPSVS